jgi:glycosyltransferase involved in cell wall biosynthesis
VTISVLIATRDRAALLAATLEALARQDPPGCFTEIVVVDNASVDGTPGVIRECATRSPYPVVHLREGRSGKSHALNTAVSHARGDVLALTDDDVLPSAGWLRAYRLAFAEGGVDFAVGRIEPLWEATPPQWLSPALYGVLAIPDGGSRRLPISRGVNEHIMPLGANMAVRRRVIDRVGGWNPDLGKLQGSLRTGEDHELSLRMLAAGFAGVYEPDALAQHRVPADRLRLVYFHRWFHDNGAMESALEDRYPSTSRYILRVPRHVWRQFVRDMGTGLGSALGFDLRRTTATTMRAAWFAGYLRGRWTSGNAPRHGTAATSVLGGGACEP